MRSKRGRGAAETGERIFDAALALFRERGFDATTMRDVASAAGTSLGAAYYYFPSKDAIVLRYYERQLSSWERVARLAIAKEDDVAKRLEAALLGHLDVVRGDRALLVAMSRFATDVTSELSVFSRATEDTRARSIAIYEEALRPAALPDDARRSIALAVWALHLGLVLHFLFDASVGAKRTRRLAREAIGLLVPLLQLARSPAFEPMFQRVVATLATSGVDLVRAPEPQRSRPARGSSRRSARRGSTTSALLRGNR